MRSLKTGLVVGVTCLFGLFLIRNRIHQPQPVEPTNPGFAQKDNQPAISASKQENQTASVAETSKIVASPYPKINRTDLSYAKARGESWTNKYEILDTWTLQLQPDTDAGELATRLGGEFVESVAAFPDIFVFRFAGSKDSLIAA